jgi:hypothetical protein
MSNSSFCTQCIYGFRVVLEINSDYLPEQHQPIDICNGDMIYFLSENN